jgi:hypothetical protein
MVLLLVSRSAWQVNDLTRALDDTPLQRLANALDALDPQRKHIESFSAVLGDYEEFLGAKEDGTIDLGQDQQPQLQSHADRFGRFFTDVLLESSVEKELLRFVIC